MGRIMEVIEKHDRFKDGLTTIKLLETTIDNSSHLLGSDPGKNWEDFTDGDILSVEGLVSLQEYQKGLSAPWTDYRNVHNEWILSVAETVFLESNEYNLNITDWASKYVADETMATSRGVLRDIARYEEEIYNMGRIYTKDLYTRNQGRLKEWSKERNYGSTVAEIKSGEAELHHSCGCWCNMTFVSDIPGVTGRWENCDDHDKNFMIVGGLQNIPVGSECTVTAYEGTPEYRTDVFSWTFKREPLGVGIDDGYWRTISTEEYDNDSFDNALYIVSPSGYHSPHFNTDDNSPTKLNLPWFKSRILR